MPPRFNSPLGSTRRWNSDLPNQWHVGKQNSSWLHALCDQHFSCRRIWTHGLPFGTIRSKRSYCPKWSSAGVPGHGQTRQPERCATTQPNPNPVHQIRQHPPHDPYRTGRTVRRVFLDPDISSRGGESIPKFPAKHFAARLGLSVTPGSLTTQRHCSNKSCENPDSRHKQAHQPHSAKTLSTTTYFAHHRTARFLAGNLNPGGEIWSAQP